MLRIFLCLASACLFFSTLTAALGAPIVDLCGLYQSYTSRSTRYVFSTNEWGYDGSGSQCVTVSEDDATFNATWIWSQNEAYVHSFPNIKLNSSTLPVQLSALSNLTFDVSWAMLNPSGSSATADLNAIDASANVVFDMFLDQDPVKSQSPTTPQYEVMVWIGEIGNKKPIGYSSSITAPTITLNNTGTVFQLYMGGNANGQYVYSWLATSQITNFSEDISPLLHYLWQASYISEANYVGMIQFGTETFHATQNVTFTATNFSLAINEGTPTPSPTASVSFSPALVSETGTAGKGKSAASSLICPRDVTVLAVVVSAAFVGFGFVAWI